ncbi:MAG: hypothetical protein KatS3mg109_0412 [Pirellulaceae bacterium]|nr:MAG: hypothetical protein KatS3mg109_0412 [Pirellulaceae bacterium]
MNEVSERKAQWWYALLLAAPRLDARERVNVGMCVGRGDRVESMLWYEDLPRLAALVSHSERAAYREMLRSIEQSLPCTLDELRLRLGAQLVLEDPRLLYDTRPEVIARLCATYCDAAPQR